MLLLQEFNLDIKDGTGVQNQVADHLSIIKGKVDHIPIFDKFLDDFLYALNVVNDIPWFTDIVNYLVYVVVPKNFSKSQVDKLKSDTKYYLWNDPYLWKFFGDK